MVDGCHREDDEMGEMGDPCKHPCKSPCTIPDSGTENKNRLTPRYRVMLHNDDSSDMAHVVRALMDTFAFDVVKASQIMLEAHQSGVAVCDVLPLEQAEFRRDKLQAWSLVATVESEG